MNNMNIIKLFAKRVINGSITIEQVPANIREEVTELVKAEGK